VGSSVDRRFGGSVVRWFVGSLVPLKSSGNFGYFVCQLLGVPAPGFLGFSELPRSHKTVKMRPCSTCRRQMSRRVRSLSNCRTPSLCPSSVALIHNYVCRQCGQEPRKNEICSPKCVRLAK